MRKTIPILFCLICFVCCEISFSQFEQNKLDSALSLALKCMKLTKEDLSLRNDYVEVDVFRQPIINSLMKEPLSTFFLVEYSFQEYLNLIGLENSVSFAGRLLDARLPITDLGIDIGWEMLYGKRATDYIKEKKNFSSLLPFPSQDSTSDSANTVQVVLILTGRSPRSAVGPSSLKSSSSALAAAPRKRPVPAAHLSFMQKSTISPAGDTRIALVSCPPMSSTVRVPGHMCTAPRPWQLISVTWVLPNVTL